MDVVTLGQARAQGDKRYQSLDNTYGMVASALPNWRKKLASVRAGTSDAKLVFLGDSTTHGDGSSTASTIPNNKSFPHAVMAMLNSATAPAAPGLVIPAASGAFDTRFTLGSGWALNGGFGYYGTCLKATNPASGSLVFADPQVTADTFDVYYLKASSGTINVTATGGSTVSAATGGAGLGVITCTAASAGTGNSVTVTQSGGAAVYVYAVEARLSTAAKIRVGNVGVPSSTTTGWVTAGAYQAQACLAQYAPDLTVIMLGINDGSASTSVATVLANIQSLVATAQLSGDAIVMTPIPSNPATQANAAAFEPQYAAAYKSGLTVPVLDLYARFGSYSATSALGFMTDDRHCNDVGYQDVAAFVHRALTRAA